MFTRIVKMEFELNKVAEFLANFDADKTHIRNFKGCRFLELYRDKNDPAIFFTYSKWDSPTDLEAYRHSELFKRVWATTKPMFRCRAQAWSVDTLVSLK